MKSLLIRIFWPILQVFEKGEGSYSYRSSHRTILVVVGVLFLVLAIGALIASIIVARPDAFIAILAFSAVGTVCCVVGCLGSERAVAKIWGSK